MFNKVVHIGLTAAFLLPIGLPATVADPDGLGSLMPYGDPLDSLEPPPPGYRPVFIESLNRHGSRALTGPAVLDSVDGLIEQASLQDDLTPLGSRLKAALSQLRATNENVGYGQLSGAGVGELEAIGQRIGPTLTNLMRSGDSVDVVTSGVSRAIDSAKSFSTGVESTSSLDMPDPRTDLPTMKFDARDPAFLSFKRYDRLTSEAIDSVDSADSVVSATRSALARLFTTDFVDGISNTLDVARDLHEILSIQPALADDGAPAMDEFMQDDDARALEVTFSARTFYRRGPGLEGRADSYQAAGILVDDFLERIDDRLGGGATAAVFRFGHLEQIVPFAAFLRLPGSDQQARPNEPYPAGDNPWQAAGIARLGSNIQWIVYESTIGAPLVSMRYNERPMPFADDCRAIASDSYMYRLSELKRCLFAPD